MSEVFAGIAKTGNYYEGIKATLVIPSNVPCPVNTQYVNWYIGLDTDAAFDKDGNYSVEVGISYGDKNSDQICEWRKFINATGTSEDQKDIISTPNPGDEIDIELINRGNGSISVYIDHYYYGSADIGIPAETGIKIVHAFEEYGGHIAWTNAEFKNIQYMYNGEWHYMTEYNDSIEDTGITINSYIPFRTDADYN